jgi:aspartate aminotransferase-like enzyme
MGSATSSAGADAGAAAVLAAMAQLMVHHRGPDFRIVYERCLERLQQVFRTRNEVLTYPSGTGGMESAVANLCSPGQRVCVVVGGSFGTRWAKIAEAYGCEVDRLDYEWARRRSRRISRHGSPSASRALCC